MPNANLRTAPLPSISCSAASGSSSDASPNGLSLGAKIGISVGCGTGGLMALAALVFCWRLFHKRRRRIAELAVGQGGPEENAAYVQHMTPNASNANYHHHQHPQELFAADLRVEADTFSPLGELPVNNQPQELETPESKYYAHYDAEGNTIPRR